MKNKKIALVVWSRGISGAAYRFARFIQHLQATGLDDKFGVDFYINRSLIEDVKNKGIHIQIKENIFVLNDFNQGKARGKLYVLFNALRFIKTSGKYSSYHFVGGGLLCLFPIKLIKILRLAKPKLVVSFVSSSLWEASAGKIRALIYIYFSMLFADHIDCLNYTNTIGKVFPKKSVSISPNSFSDNESYAYNGVYDDKEEAIAFVGSFNKRKQPFLFLDVVKLLYASIPCLKYYMIGDGVLCDEVMDRVSKFSRDLQNKIIICHLNSPIEVLHKTKIFLSLQLVDNYPSQSVLEAMLSQNYVIATSYGDTYRFIKKNFSCLLKNNCAEEIVFEIKNFLCLPKDQQDNISCRARDFVLKECTIEKFTEYFFNIHSSMKDDG